MSTTRVTRQQAQQQQLTDSNADAGPEENEENEDDDDEYQDADYVNNYVTSQQTRSERVSVAPVLSTSRRKGWVQDNKSTPITKFTRQNCTFGSYRVEKWVKKVAIKDEAIPDTKPVYTANNTLVRDHNSRRRASKSGRTHSWVSASQATQNAAKEEEEEPEANQEEEEEEEEQQNDDVKSIASIDTNAMEDDETSNTDETNGHVDGNGLEDILEEDE